MENASKALIIAGAILLAILIISLGIVIYNQASGVVNSNSMSDVEITQFNSKFTQYQGKQSGNNVRTLIQDVISNNVTQDDASRQIQVYYTGGSATNKLILDKTSASVAQDDMDAITTAGTYTVKIEYGTSGSANAGLVTKITITKKQ